MIVDRMLGARVLSGAVRVGTLVVAGALATGCYAYNTPHLSESERLTGRQVQATLTDSGSVVLAGASVVVAGASVGLAGASVVLAGASVVLAGASVVRAGASVVCTGASVV